ncbi:MAG: TonB-dependent receptor [Planctomycetota bacterium]
MIVREAEVRDGDVLDAVPLEHAGGRTVLGPQIVRDSGAVSVQELLRRSPGVVIQDETGSDSLPNIAMRGVTNGAEGAWRSINLGMYADGIPLAPAPYGAPGNSLFPFALERVYAVDVQRGGGAVRYGPNNVSGVVNFLTRPIPEQATVFGKVRADSFDNYAYYTAMGGTTGPFGALLEVVYKNGETWREGGDYELENYALKTSYELSDRLRLLAQFEKFDDDTNLADGLSLAAYQADPKQTQAPLNRFSGSQERANVKLEWDIDSDTRFELISYWYDGNRTFHLGSPIQYGSTPPAYIQTTPRPMRTVALQPQLTRSYLLGDVESELHVGLRYLQEDLVRTVSRYFADGSTQLRRSESQFDYYTASAWLENTLRWGDWTVTPGLRFEYVRIDARDRLNGNSAGQEFTEVLPGLTVNRRLTQQVAVFAAVQSTFAAPQAAQIDLANHPQDVSAQHAWNYEVGGRGSFFDALFDVDLTLYQIEYRDRLVRDPNQFDVFVNGGNSRHRGVELALRSDLGRVGLTGVSLWGSAAYNDSRFTDGAFDGNRFAGAPAWIASWGARYQHAATGLFCSVDGSYVDAIYTDALNTVVINAAGTNGVRPSYRLWNASAGWRHDVSEQTQLGVLVGGRNVFDEQYGEPRTGRGIFPGAPASIFFEFDFTHRF